MKQEKFWYIKVVDSREFIIKKFSHTFLHLRDNSVQKYLL
jgi:hypothetical protein